MSQCIIPFPKDHSLINIVDCHVMLTTWDAISNIVPFACSFMPNYKPCKVDHQRNFIAMVLIWL